ncbi:glycosyltransferase family 39 protein [Methylobacterium sp. WL103]|uniref:ArnT family glycosyltransferase n=1 Tax=unclassified Methylobacterium TaxID=2615210 RepID=UPI0011C77611|nr:MULTISPECIES: glycosyltransferase family 39 protein [unclassified Methylobacterium]TXM73050.1 glycosyltransferase family 39 protein [Methylobacterium sp. WL12]TXM96177.1 glycosyltransferase family 39 protein [Methylobacterium sp. WL103]
MTPSEAAGRPVLAARPGPGFAFGDFLLNTVSASHARACAWLLALCLVCFLPGQISLQPMDRDEPRFAQASKQMLETGDGVDIRFQGEARHKKPVGIYWAQAAAVAAVEALGVPEARTAIALYRIPSLLGATAAVLLAYWAALAFLARRGAFLASALFGACLMLAAEAHLAKTDALLTACSVASLGALARAWLGRSGPGPSTAGRLAFWLGLALGILVKGPMVPLFVGLPMLALSWKARSGRWILSLRPWSGLAIVALIVAPWFLAIAWRSGGAFFTEAVGHDMLAKVGSAKEKHWAPPGTYALVFFATYWPGAAFAALAIPFAWRRRGDDAVAFLLASIVPAWAMFEAVPTKLPHYVLPLMPMVAILTVLALRAGALDPTRRGARAVALLVPAIPVGLTIGLVAVAWRLDRVLPVLSLPLLGTACALACAAWMAYARGGPERAMVFAILSACLLSPAVLGLAQTEIPALKVSNRLAAIRDALPCRPQVASLGYREPSLVFLIGTDLATPNTGADALAFLNAGGCRLVFVEQRSAADFADAWPVGGAGPKAVGQVSGFNINAGRRVDLTAYAVTPAAQTVAP